MLEDLKAELARVEQALQMLNNDMLRVQGIRGYLKDKISKEEEKLKGEKVEEIIDSNAGNSVPYVPVPS